MSDKTKIITFSLLILLWQQFCIAQDHYFATLNNVKSRPLAMGSAFTSIDDDLEAVTFNPATFTLYKNKKNFRVTFFFNPVSSLVAFHEYSHNFHQKINKTDFINASGLLIKAVIISSRFIDTGIIFGEESLTNVYNQHSSKWFELNDSWNNSANTFATCFKLAERVSIGVSGTLYYRRSNNILKRGIGFSYGILLKPNDDLNVGLAYMDLPKNMSDFRLPLERIVDETMNIGISYRPTSSTIFSIDIRNLTEEKKENVRELHIGLEQSIFSIAALRIGYFKERFTPHNNYSIGVGILDSNLLFKEKNQFNHHDFIINYSFVYQETKDRFLRWHFFSLLLRI